MWFNMPKMFNEMTLSTLLFIYLFIYSIFFSFYIQLKMALKENEPRNINIAITK